MHRYKRCCSSDSFRRCSQSHTDGPRLNETTRQQQSCLHRAQLRSQLILWEANEPVYFMQLLTGDEGNSSTSLRVSYLTVNNNKKKL